VKLAIFGATGQTGMEIVKHALASGHEVTAVARTLAKLGEFQSKVKLVQGDVTDPNTVDEATAGVDAVLCALGHAKGSPPDLFSKSSSNIVTAMNSHGVKRLVVLANIAVRDPGDSPRLYHRFLRFLLTLTRSQMCKDTVEGARIISESGVDWTIARAVILTNDPPSGKYRTGMLDNNAGTRISRADVANFMIACAVGAKYVKAKPLIS
jgi:putative NADH-flavin reductase